MLRLPNSDPGPAAVLLPVLLLTFLTGLFPLTADYVLFHPDERHYADAGIRMLETGDYLTPRTAEGDLRLKKPILPYWCVVAGYHTVGVSPLGARLGFLLAGAGVVGLSWWGASIAFDSRRAACFAAVAATCQPALLISAPRSVPDVCLALGIQLSVCGFLLMRRQERATWAALATAFGGGVLAVLSKGLPAVAFLATATMITIWQSPALLIRDWRRWALAAASCANVGGSWFMLMGRLHADELAQQLVNDQVGPNRFAVTPWQVLLQFLLCVGLLLAMSAPWIAVAMRELRSSESRSSFIRQPGVLLIAGWALVFCALASTINHVTPRYLLPAAAPLSILIGGLLNQVDREQLRSRLWRVLVIVAAVAGAGITATAVMIADRPVRVLVLVALIGVAGAVALARSRFHGAVARSLWIALMFHALLFVGGVGMSSWPTASIGRQVREHHAINERRTVVERIVFAGETSQATQIRVALGGRTPVLSEANVNRVSPADVLVLDDAVAMSRDLSKYDVDVFRAGYEEMRTDEVVRALLAGRLQQLLSDHERRFVIATPRENSSGGITHTTARIPLPDVE